MATTTAPIFASPDTAPKQKSSAFHEADHIFVTSLAAPAGYQESGDIFGVSPTAPQSYRFMNLVLDEGSVRGTPAAVEQAITVSPSKKPTVVVARAQLTAGAAALRSPEFYKAVRRGALRKVIGLIRELESPSQERDFCVYTFPIVEEISETLKRLTDSRTEGNSREILRQLRDSLMDGGWEHYRNGESRKAVTVFLEKILSLDEVTPKQEGQFFDLLMSHGLMALPYIALENDQEKEVHG